MIPAWYIKFKKGHHGSLDRVGGLPTHVPPEYPVDDGEMLQFVAQFECDAERLPVADTFLLQIYRGDPCSSTADPVAVRVPFGAKENTNLI